MSYAKYISSLYEGCGELLKGTPYRSKQKARLRHAALTGVPDSGEADESWRPEVHQWLQGDNMWTEICDGWDEWSKSKNKMHESFEDEHGIGRLTRREQQRFQKKFAPKNHRKGSMVKHTDNPTLKLISRGSK